MKNIQVLDALELYDKQQKIKRINVEPFTFKHNYKIVNNDDNFKIYYNQLKQLLNVLKDKSEKEILNIELIFKMVLSTEKENKKVLKHYNNIIRKYNEIKESNLSKTTKQFYIYELLSVEKFIHYKGNNEKAIQKINNQIIKTKEKLNINGYNLTLYKILFDIAEQLNKTIKDVSINDCYDYLFYWTTNALQQAKTNEVLTEFIKDKNGATIQQVKRNNKGEKVTKETQLYSVKVLYNSKHNIPKK